MLVPDERVMNKRFQEIQKLARMHNIGGDAIINIVMNDLGKRERLSVLEAPCRAAIREIAEVIEDPEKKTGYRINGISSGKTTYMVFRDAPENDEVETIGEYETEEEAEQAEYDEHCYIVSGDPDAWYAVLNKEGRNETGTVWSTPAAAWVSLLDLAKEKVPAWTKYNEILNEMDLKVPFWGGKKVEGETW